MNALRLSAVFGILVLIFQDGNLIRALLVPSLMELLGKWNWWAPRPLRRVYDRFGLSEGGAPSKESLASA